MNINLKCAIYFCMLFAITSCQAPSDNVFVNAFKDKEVYELIAQKVELNTNGTYLSYMFEMVYFDSLLFINEFPHPEYCMKIIDLRTKEVRNFAKKGRGPNEIQSQACEYCVNMPTQKLFVADQGKCFAYSIDSLLQIKDKPVNKYLFRNQGVDFLSTTYCHDFIVGNAIDNRFAAYNIKTKNVQAKYSYPNGPIVDQAKFYSHPSKKIIAWFQSESATMGLLYFDKNESLMMKELYSFDPESRELTDGNIRTSVADDNNRNGFITATVSEKYIYALYSGKIIDPSSIESLTKAFLSDIVYVLDWEGHAVKKYKLDREVRSIAVDEKNNTLYAASYESGGPFLIKYNIKQ